MHINYKSFEIASRFTKEELLELPIRNDLPIIKNAFNLVNSIDGSELFQLIDFVFVNTELFSERALYFKKNNCYTKLHPLYDEDEYDAFWDEEEKRRKEGLVRPCALEQDTITGKYQIRNLHITGLHYGYLNYAKIKRIDEKSLNNLSNIISSDKFTGKLKMESKITDFPQFFDTDYYYWKSLELSISRGEHSVNGKARRKGFSYKNGWLAADRADRLKNSTTILGAFESDSLYPEGTMTMADNYLQDLSKHTAWAKRRLIDRKDFIKFGYKFNDGTGAEYGYKSKIIAKSFAPNNAGAARGKDGDVVLLEESGKNKLLLQVLSSTLPTLGAGVFTTGLCVVFGTGGGDENLWSGFETLMFNPSSFNFTSFNNIWDENTDGTECGFFIPSYAGKEGFIDKWGNSNVRGAIEYEEKIRAKKKKSNDTNAYLEYCMEEPFNPSEAFRRSLNKFFNTKLLEEQLKELQTNEDLKNIARHGYFKNTSDGIKFIDYLFENDKREQNHPILEFPLKKGTNPKGCFTMWFNPYRDKNTGLIPDNLYYLWVDPFNVEKDLKTIDGRSSLGCIYVYERSNSFSSTNGDILVGKYLGRTATLDEFNDMLFMIADYYNAKILAETGGDIYGYAKRNKKIHQLMDEPTNQKNENVMRIAKMKNKLITMTTDKKLDGVIYLNDWLNKIRRRENDGKEIRTINYIFDIRLIKELLKFDLKNNFDSVSSCILGQFVIKELVDKIYKMNTISRISVFDREWF